MEGQDRDLTELRRIGNYCVGYIDFLRWPREVWLHPSPGSLVVTIPVR